jgi:acyl-CoA synthetase (AMP-forming)/AMP-acid ligase II
VPYEDAAVREVSERPVRGPWGRSGDDLFLLYTGGTTGLPKGVMWRQDDVFGLLDATSKPPMGPEQDLDALLARTTRPGPRAVPAAPLMHGTAAFNSFSVLVMAGCIVTMPGRHFDAVELLDTIQRERVGSISIVGDAFAKPMLRALDAEPDRWDISSLRVIMSSGVMWSVETKAGLLRHNARLILVDALGSSEAIGMANDISTADAGSKKTAAFQLGANTKVITEDGRDVVPGSGERGRLALKGRVPLGYYKDPEKSAATFVTIAGARYSIPGDWAEVDVDGTVKLLGRGSVCINTGGEKVYPEEVEEVLKLHPSVADAVVVGVPDEKWGEAITAIVEPYPGADVDEGAVIAHVKERLAPYKAPKRVLVVATIGRAPNGKVDYRRLKGEATERVGGG